MANFVQLLLLTLWIKVDWNCDSCEEDSSLTVYTVDALNIVNLNFEIFHFGKLQYHRNTGVAIVTCVECFFSIQDIVYYLKWLSSVIVPLLCVIIGGLFDYILVNYCVCILDIVIVVL